MTLGTILANMSTDVARLHTVQRQIVIKRILREKSVEEGVGLDDLNVRRLGSELEDLMVEHHAIIERLKKRHEKAGEILAILDGK